MRNRISFMNDYSESACYEILKLLLETNHRQYEGYGTDEICEAAKECIYREIGTKDAEIHFLMGGTQTNKTVIAASLRSYEAVIAVDTGHINVHETGAIENSGHKVVAVPGKDGKITPDEIEKAVLLHTDEHMVKPAMVYISDATELGTVYSKAELTAISSVCKKYGLKLFLDGARLGSALTSRGNDCTMKDLTEFCDVFYIGGTKNGALFGEAVVISNPEISREFRYQIKQNGAMLAKGWVLGIQFLGLFRDQTFYQLAEHANQMADRIRQCLKRQKMDLLVETETNQIFVILEDERLKCLEEEFAFTFWEKTDDTHTAVRIVTSWDTKEEHVDKLIQALEG